MNNIACFVWTVIASGFFGSGLANGNYMPAIAAALIAIAFRK